MNDGKCNGNTVPVARDDGRLAFSFPREDDVVHADLELAKSGENGQLLLLVNGFQRPRADFRALRRRLHAALPTLATLAIDNRGSGDSSLSRPEKLSIETMARDAAAIAEHVSHNLGLSHYAVLGISMGGMIALTLAAANPNLTHLILVSTSPGGTLGVIPQPLPSGARPGSEAESVARMERYFGRRFFATHELVIRAFAKAVAEVETKPGAADRADAQRRAVNRFAAAAFLSDVASPTLVLTGTDDRVIPPENSRALAAHLPLAELREYEGAGHLLLVEEPHRFADDVAHFLSPVL